MNEPPFATLSYESGRAPPSPARRLAVVAVALGTLGLIWTLFALAAWWAVGQSVAKPPAVAVIVAVGMMPSSGVGVALAWAFLGVRHARVALYLNLVAFAFGAGTLGLAWIAR